MATDNTVKRVAIQKDGYFHILYHLNMTSTLSEVVKDICSKWTLNRPDQYALQYLDTKLYITEDNQAEIRDGDILTVTFNVELAAAKFLSDIEQPDITVKRKALDELAGTVGPGQAEDPMFAKEFLSRNGVNALVRLIESAAEPSHVIAQSMAALQELLEHGFVSWDQSVNQRFLDKILAFSNKPDGNDPRVIQRALSLLDNIVTVSSTLFILVMNKVVMENIIGHLNSNDAKLQLSAVSLINSILTRMEHENRKKFSAGLGQKGYTEALQKIITSSQTLSSEMNHQLYIYQALLLGLLEPQLTTRPDVHNTELNNSLVNIYNIAFESSSTKEKGTGRPDFKKLGFENGDLPLKDFEETPPGVLACDVMVYFATFHQSQYNKIVLENSSRDEEYQCPFGRVTKQLTKMLAEVLNVGTPISETSEAYQPMFFSSPQIFHELYSVTVQLLNKTWKEMRATSADFNRVISVVKDQIKRVLNDKPDTIETLKTKAFSLTYQQFLKLMQQEAQERNILDSQTKPVMELRQQIEPEIRELVRQQRLAQLVEGEHFKQVLRGKIKSDKYWYCCLSPNHRFLHYVTDLTGKDNMPPNIDTLPHKLPLADVTKLELGKDCTHLKSMKKFLNLTFSLFHGQDENLDFVATNDKVLFVWVDGLSSLLGKKMSSKAFQEDLDMLLNMEMKLRLLDLEDVTIPDVPPPIPKEPDNYDFFYRD